MKNTIKQEIAQFTKSKIIFPTINFIERNCWSSIQEKISSIKHKTIDEVIDVLSWKKISIVWNAPLIWKKYWEQIDFADLVIRFNKWILKLDNDYTWLRTDYWVTWSMDTLISVPIIKEVLLNRLKISILVPFPFYNPDIDLWKINVFTLEKLYKYLDKYYMPNDIFKDSVEKIWNSYIPTSGFSIVNYILNKCGWVEIMLYWFTFSNNNRSNWIIDSSLHNYKKEEEYFLEWKKKWLLYIHN